MANAVVNTFKSSVLKGDFDLENDTIKLMLLNNSHTTDIDAQEFIDDVSVNEVSASGSYSAGGVTLASKTVTTDDTNDKGVFDAADISITSATITAYYGVLYKDTGTPGTSPIIGIYDFGGAVGVVDGTMSINFSSDGALTIA